MSEVKTKKVTFDTSLPRGTCATFTHDGERWIAYPQHKAAAVGAVIDRMVGTLDRVHDDLVRWINMRPEDAALIVPMMSRTVTTRELAREKVRAWTI
jgi:hypothetical protein